jgi:predicted Na+-dependent transporter
MDAFGIISIIFLAIIGLGMGATTTRDDFSKALAKTSAPAIGFFSQYFFMPLFALTLCKIFDLKEAYAVGTYTTHTTHYTHYTHTHYTPYTPYTLHTTPYTH